MFLRYILKHIKRGAVVNALFCALLALSGALLCVGAGVWYSAHDALVNIDGRVTTIAVPDLLAVNRRAQSSPDETAEDILKNIRETIYGAGLLPMDSRRTFNAYSPGISSVPIRAVGFTHTVYVADHSPQSAAAFIGVCESVAEQYYIYRYQSGDAPRIRRYIRAEFTVEQTLYLNSAYDRPRRLYINLFCMEADGSIPAETGKRYVLAGYNYSPMSATMNILYPDFVANDQITGEVNSKRELALMGISNWEYMSIGDEEDFPLDVVSYIMEPDDTGFEGFSSFELEGGLEETLAAEHSGCIKDALAVVEVSHNSLQILTTGNMNSLPHFNQLRRFLAAGRMFTPKEAAEGARVCLISAQFAEVNKLTVGGKLPLRLYPLELLQMTFNAPEGENGAMVERTYYIPSLYRPGLEISEDAEYKIIGIYNALTLQSGDYGVTNNTVIIPDKSFAGIGPDMDEVYAESGLPPLLADALVIENGGVDEAKAVIDSVLGGYGALLRFYDQGYLNISAALANLRVAAAWIFAFAAAGWVMAVLMFSLFFAVRKKRETALLHAIGVSAPKRFRWVFIQCALLIILAQCAAFGAGLTAYGAILERAAKTAESFTDSFRDYAFSDEQPLGKRGVMPIDAEPLAVIAAAAGQTALLIGVSGYISKKAAAFGALNETKEGE